ncbi:retrotransposon hot spot (RHS) protein, putative [Trypanosoma cruzi]|nr:retrotransposon hot spot (RHS) protein, putative [Trypanosoma cruzi]
MKRDLLHVISLTSENMIIGFNGVTRPSMRRPLLYSCNTVVWDVVDPWIVRRCSTDLRGLSEYEVKRAVLKFFSSVPVSAHLGNKTLFNLAKLLQQVDFNFLISWLTDCLMHANFGRSTVFAFLNVSFVSGIERRPRELRPSPQRRSHRCALEVYSQERSTRHHVLPPLEHFSERIDVECGVLYVTEVENFPLADGFFFVKSNPMTLVGLRMTTTGGHHTTTSTVRQFTEYLAAYFNGWEELSRQLSWEIIYVQHADSTPMNDWQRCGVVDSNNVSRAENREIAVFWEEEVHQYMAAISSDDARRF